jgi:RNA recognition motif-containing protein
MLIYVWNLSLHVSENCFCETLKSFGQVSSATIPSTNVKDSDNCQLPGFAFVEMPDQTEARAAIENLDRRVLLGRRMILYGSSDN